MDKMSTALKRMVNGLGEHRWLHRPFFWAGFFPLRLLFPLQYLLLRELIDCDSVLDLGCGRHSMVPIIPDKIYKVGVELFDAHYREAVAKGRHNEVIQKDIMDAEFTDKSFDAVVLLDVIEHLDKEDGRRLISRMERWARKKVVVFTPNGFLHQEGLEDNPLMVHRSGWTVSDFKELGFQKVYGVRGFKEWKKGCHAHDHGCEGSVDGVADLAQLVTYHVPEKAFQLFCVKKPDR